MCIKLITEKVIVRGEPHRKIMAVKMLGYKELPKEYTERGPSCFHGGNLSKITLRQNISANTTLNFEMVLPLTIPEKDFKTLKDFMFACGDRLMKINKQRKAKHHDWQGVEVIKI